jgi:hypothetical protein
MTHKELKERARDVIARMDQEKLWESICSVEGNVIIPAYLDYEDALLMNPLDPHCNQIMFNKQTMNWYVDGLKL